MGLKLDSGWNWSTTRNVLALAADMKPSGRVGVGGSDAQARVLGLGIQGLILSWASDVWLLGGGQALEAD